jgi:cysteinyl-tRNA synthetase
MFTKSKFEDQELSGTAWGLGISGGYRMLGHRHKFRRQARQTMRRIDIPFRTILTKYPVRGILRPQVVQFLVPTSCPEFGRAKDGKSSGEFLTVAAIEMGYAPLAYRFFCLQSNTKSIVVSWENHVTRSGL